MISRLVRFATILSILTIAWVAGAPAQVLLRKNIDLLSADELAAYEHAMQILIDRSGKKDDHSDGNPFDRSSYLWQAWIHNCPFIWQASSGKGPHSAECDDISFKPDPTLVGTNPGMCEHHKDLFLIWHRGQFYYFEKLLQATDPDGTVLDGRGKRGPSTRNVTVPYWNWTRPPSGARYPKALENPDSPLFVGAPNRNQGALTPQEQALLKQVTNPLMVSALVNSDWSVFGGFPQEAPTGSGGLFEHQHHDPMHAFYFGGFMGRPSTAALDPGFFSFHAYIDLVLQFWLDQHGPQTVTSLDHFLRATQPDNIPPAPGFAQGAGLPSMGQARIYLDPAKLGYGYEVTDADKLPPPEAIATALAAPTGGRALFAATDKSRFARLAGHGLFDPSVGAPTMIAKIAVPVSSEVGHVQGVFQRPPDAPDINYLVDFYLHPAGLNLDLARDAGRDKYIVASLGYMGRGGGHGGHNNDGKPLFVDLAPPLKDLASTGHTGEMWTLTAVVSGQPPSPSFGTLSLLP
jgi:tyrosinase